ncbi:MAG: HD domain-containing protein, partial [Thiomicrorhabdus sp.]|nr:HD domain-containing protein [Thiomicrorhabdus sp.]
ERVWQEVVKALNTESPSVFFEVLDRIGGMEGLFPHLFALHGVEQPVKYHPEGDVWIHSLMVLDAAAQLSTDAMVRFAALVHDLGKGLTDPALWPKHYGHEAAGVPLVAELCRAYRVPKKWQQQAERVTEWHGLIHQGLTSEGKPFLKPKTYLKVLKSCGALKDVSEFKQILLACEADAKGRLGFESCDYPQKEFWLALAQVATEVNHQEIIQKGFQGAEISQEIEKVRLKLIAGFLKTYPENWIGTKV